MSEHARSAAAYGRRGWPLFQMLAAVSQESVSLRNQLQTDENCYTSMFNFIGRQTVPAVPLTVMFIDDVVVVAVEGEPPTHFLRLSLAVDISG